LKEAVEWYEKSRNNAFQFNHPELPVVEVTLARVRATLE
jgi:hypothetical protein